MDHLAVQLGHSVDHLRSRNAAGRGHFPFAGFDQIVVHERKDQVGLNPCAVAVDDAKAVGITIGGQPRGSAGVDYGLPQRRKILFGDVGPGPVE